MAIEIDIYSGFTQLENGGSFHSYVKVYQRVVGITSTINKILWEDWDFQMGFLLDREYDTENGQLLWHPCSDLPIPFGLRNGHQSRKKA